MLPTTDECYHLPILAIRFSKENTAKARDTKVDDQLGDTCVDQQHSSKYPLDMVES